MAGILDFLSGSPDLSVTSKLGVDPNSLAAFKQIQDQAETAALGPALVGGVLSALAGQRRGAGLRAIEGAGRAYTSAKQQAEQEPIAMATFAQNQRLANMKLEQEKTLQGLRQQEVETNKKHVQYMDWQMSNSPNAVVPADMIKARLDPLLNSQFPEVRASAQKLAGQPLTGTQLNQTVNELEKHEAALRHPGNKTAYLKDDTGWTAVTTDANGNQIQSYRINGANAGPGVLGLPSKIETSMRQQYNADMKQQEKNRQSQADMLADKNNTLGRTTGHVDVLGYPLSYADWMATPAARAQAKAAGATPAHLAKMEAYAKTRVLPGQQADTIPANMMKAVEARYPEKKPVFVASKNYWVERRGNKWYRITAPLTQDPTLSMDPTKPGPATVGKKGLGLGDLGLGDDNSPPPPPAASTGESTEATEAPAAPEA